MAARRKERNREFPIQTEEIQEEKIMRTMRTACAILILASACLAAEKEEGFVAIFNGKDLTGWQGNKEIWTVKDGMLVGKAEKLKHNEFLSHEKTFGDFILRFEIRLVDGKGNSGFQFRSERVPNSTEVSGYQADVGEAYWGCLYDESRRNRVLISPDPETLKKALKPKDWNDYEVKAVGDTITLSINGTKMIEYKETDAKIARAGIIAPQVHAGDRSEVNIRNIRIKEIK